MLKLHSTCPGEHFEQSNSFDGNKCTEIFPRYQVDKFSDFSFGTVLKNGFYISGQLFWRSTIFVGKENYLNVCFQKLNKFFRNFWRRNFVRVAKVAKNVSTGNIVWNIDISEKKVITPIFSKIIQKTLFLAKSLVENTKIAFNESQRVLRLYRIFLINFPGFGQMTWGFWWKFFNLPVKTALYRSGGTFWDGPRYVFGKNLLIVYLF